jgi:hypothetical protein
MDTPLPFILFTVLPPYMKKPRGFAADLALRMSPSGITVFFIYLGDLSDEPRFGTSILFFCGVSK